MIRSLIYFALIAMLTFSCTSSTEFLPDYDDDDDDDTSESSGEEAGVNEQIYEQYMSSYLWRDSIPSLSSTNLNLSVTNYVDDEIRYRVDNSVEYYYDIYGDRFSYVEYDGSTVKADDSSSGDSIEDWGFSYVAWTSSYSSYIHAQVLYIVPDSPADNAGLKRGDIISEIDGSVLTLDNVSTLMSGSSITLQLVDNQLKDLSSMVLTSSSFDNTPLIYSTIFESSSPKTAYLFFSDFKNESQYILELQEMFTGFKSEGVENIIVDLRYNLGGYVTTANYLASWLTASQSDLGNSIMYQMQTNASSSNLTPVKYYSLPAIGGASTHVAPTKIAFIMTGYSASSSEMVYNAINKLYPADNCIMVGSTSYGKNLASNEYTIDSYSIHPITARVYDCYGVSGYENGFDPDVTASDLDSYYLTMEDIGDVSERMLNAALNALGVSIPNLSSEADVDFVQTRSGSGYKGVVNMGGRTPRAILP